MTVCGNEVSYIRSSFPIFSVFSLLQVVDTLRKLPDAKAMCALLDFVRDGSF